MVDAKKLYPNFEESYGESAYDPMVNAFGNVVIQVDDNGYQGDTRVLYNNDGKIGYLIFGWGSCCVCDALQGCASLEEIQELCNELESDILWFDLPKKLLSGLMNMIGLAIGLGIQMKVSSLFMRR